MVKSNVIFVMMCDLVYLKLFKEINDLLIGLYCKG